MFLLLSWHQYCNFSFLKISLLRDQPVFVCLSLCSSEEWKKVSKNEREKIGVTVQDDGEFW